MEWFIGIILLTVALSSIRIVNQYERGVVLTLGRFTGIREPGLRFVVPVVQQMTKVDMRTMPIDVPHQEVITRDNVTATVDAVVYFRVVNPDKAILQNTNYLISTSQFSQAALRDVVGNADLDDLLSKRDEMSQQIKQIVDAQTDHWGVDVEAVKLQNIELPADMKRAMARQAEAERNRRAVIITADGEKAAAQKVADAAEILGKATAGVNIRTLQTLEKISNDPNQKTVIMLPSELSSVFETLASKKR